MYINPSAEIVSLRIIAQNSRQVSLSTAKISEIVSGRLIGPGDIMVSTYLIDSRKVTLISGEALFIALPGKRSDGHIYIDRLYERGLRAFLVSSEFVNSSLALDYPQASFITCENTLEALQRLASYKRSIFQGRVFGITGSNGKTIVKEWFADILGKNYRVLRSPRSYNSQTGVPLSVIKLEDSFDYAVFEAGMSRPGEIEKLEAIIQPDIAVFTNIGEAHQENFRSLESKIKEKLNLFRRCSGMIYCSDHKDIDRLVKDDPELSNKKILTWSFKKKGSVNFSRSSDPGGNIILGVSYKELNFPVKLPYSDHASVQNAAIVISMLLSIGMEEEKIRKDIEQIRPVEMRMEQKEGINGCTLIEDYYNSDPAALGIALDYLGEMPGDNKRVIISDFVEQKAGEGKKYREVASMLEKAGISKLICVGRELTASRSLFDKGSLFFESSEELLDWLTPDKFRDEIILLKGARKFEFERISAVLEQKAHITTLEINLKNLLDNLNEYRSGLNPGTLSMAMVKAFAYGAGSRQISEWLVNNGIDFLAVAYIDEGQLLRRAGISSRIVVMNPDPASFGLMIDNDLEPEIFSLDLLRGFIEECRKSRLDRYPVHIKIDTGMHRLGFMQEEINELIEVLTDQSQVKIASVFSHLAASEDPALDHETRKQASVFSKSCKSLERELGYSFIRHLLNSTGTARFPEYQYDMVRLGIGLFGTGYEGIKGMKPVLSFMSSVSQVKRVKAGEGIGYGLTDRSDHDRDIAIVPVGYADGLKRMLGNGRGRVYVRSAYAPLVGRVSMDMCMVDVSGLGVKAGDRVEIFGNKIPISELADKCDTIAYEILTSIPARVKRIYLYE